jgi:hypothetical protein
MVTHSGMMKMMKVAQQKFLRRIIMTKHIMVVALVTLLVIALAGVSQAGSEKMEDPYGLLQDEAVFLTHTPQIVQGEGVMFYDHYRFTYTDVTGWSYSLDQFNTVGTLIDYYDLAGEGERRNSADNVLHLLQTDKVRIEWSTGSGVAVLFDI